MLEEERLEGGIHHDVGRLKVPYSEAEVLNFTTICELRTGILSSLRNYEVLLFSSRTNMPHKMTR